MVGGGWPASPARPWLWLDVWLARALAGCLALADWLMLGANGGTGTKTASP